MRQKYRITPHTDMQSPYTFVGSRFIIRHMKGTYFLRTYSNKFFRFFKFGHIGGKNSISLKATILRKGLRLTLGTNTTIGEYARLSGRGNGTIEIGDHTSIGEFVILETRKGGSIKIGNHSGINAFSVVYGAGGVTIGDYTRIASHTVIVASNHNFDDVTKNIHEQGISAKGVSIGNDVWIGAGVRILDGVHIGDHAVIGAGSVVTKDIPENAVALGVPARVIRKRGEQRNT